MNNIYKIINNKSNKECNFKFEYYSSIEEINDSNKLNIIQEAFINSYLINDINIKDNNYNVLTYLSNTPIFLILKNNKYYGFISFYQKPSLTALGFNIFITKKLLAKEFKELFINSIRMYSWFIRDKYECNYMYFDIGSSAILKWIKEVVPDIKYFFIRKNYIICYNTVTLNYINNIMLNGYTIQQC